MREIPVGKHHVALIDDEDVVLVEQYRWRLWTSPNGLIKYAYRHIVDGRGRPLSTQMMHTVITGFRIVDHRNHDGLDNRRSNLRAATAAQNSQNAKKPRVFGMTSRFKGVCWDPQKKRWRVSIHVGGPRRHVGYFKFEDDAAAAYDAAAIEHFGEYAYTNADGAALTPEEFAALRAAG